MNRLWRILLVAQLLLLLWVPYAPVSAQEEATLTEAERLWASLSVDERVGQLFLVTFYGDSAFPGSEIANLILTYRIGGVVLQAEQDNITGYGSPATIPQQVTDLTTQLQQLALDPETAVFPPDPAADESIFTPTPEAFPDYTPLPLFIAVNHEGGGYPDVDILNGLTQIPSNMAIGATWDPDYATAVGEIVAQELSALGINMVLGPSLDVLETPRPTNPADIGVRTFGGDPYWAGLMGLAYTEGLHQGADGRMAVIASHFPGNGSSDRPVYDEVPTVRKSLEQLKQIELAPFFAVTAGQTRINPSVVDGLLSTHIRYQGFQGNIRATTVPVSFDPQALKTLLNLEQFAPWRQSGGIIVSDALGVRSVEKFYDDTEQEFPHRRVAKDAFLAGNDLLYLDDFALGNNNFETEIANMKDTVRWFREKYETDPTFQQRVDEAGIRILQLKMRLYGAEFTLENVTRSIAEERPSAAAAATIQEITQAGMTLISPSPGELVERLTSPPGPDDQILIFTDVRRVQQCSTCIPLPVPGPTALEQRMLALYGPDATGQVQPNQIHSFSFANLADFLAAGSSPILSPALPVATPEPDAEAPELVLTPTPPPEFWVQEWLQEATWIIFALQEAGPETQVLNQFLAERTDLLRERKVIVFAYDAPYYLDTTEISKLTAYYGLYSKTSAAIDASVRALFQELPLNGTLPVNVPSIGYDLFQQTEPDPEQVIELYIAAEDGGIQGPPSQEPLDVSVGDTLKLQTGVIRDHNGHPVPDGTVVQFIQQDRIQGLVNIIANIPTISGTAILDFVLEARTGQFRITAVSEDAVQSQAVDIIIEDEAQVAIVTPTPAPTATPTPTPTPTSTPTPSPMPTLVPTIPATPSPPAANEPGVRISFSELQMLAALLGGLVLLGGGSFLASRYVGTSLEQRLGWLFWGLSGGLLLYNYYGLGLPGVAFLEGIGSWAGLLTTLVGGTVGVLAYQMTQLRS